MNRIIENISKELETQVQLKELEISDIIRDIPPIISILEKGFLQIKSMIAEYEFKDKSEEIFFFKEVKPKLFFKLIYYKKVHNIELNRPVCGHVTIKEYLEREQEYINSFYHKNNEFIQYYRLGKTILDEYYFLRNRQELELNTECFYFERDLRFSTNFDFKASELLANDMLATYLEAELIRLKQGECYAENPFGVKPKDKWTDTKAALVELIYAIHTEKSINFGNIDLRVLSATFEKVFNIELGDIYRIFLEIRGRKGNRTVYLSRLIDALNKRMDNADSK